MMRAVWGGRLEYGRSQATINRTRSVCASTPIADRGRTMEYSFVSNVH